MAGGQIQSFCWNSETNFLAAIQDTQLVVWYCPSACYDVNLLRLSSFTRDTFDFGKNPRIDGFVGNFVSVRRSDGALINVPISPFPAILHKSKMHIFQIVKNTRAQHLQMRRRKQMEDGSLLVSHNRRPNSLVLSGGVADYPIK